MLCNQSRYARFQNARILGKSASHLLIFPSVSPPLTLLFIFLVPARPRWVWTSRCEATHAFAPDILW